MNAFDFYSPTHVYFGTDGTEKIGNLIKQHGGTKVLLHYGTDRVLTNGLMDSVIASLNQAGLPYVLLGGVVPNPRVSLVREGVKLVREEGIDFIFSVGGGSVIDSGKAIAMASVNDADIWDIFNRLVEPTAFLPNANIVTLAAAGSETSNSCVITNEENWLKQGFRHNALRSKFTIMDPSLLYTLPPYQTACGIVDIMMHSLDRYFSPGGTNEMTDSIAEALLRVTMRYGKRCMENPEDYEARSEVMWAGSLSHNDLTGLGRLGDFSPHKLEHELSGKYDVAHGAGLSAVWGAWARYVYKVNPLRFARYGVEVLGLTLDAENPETTALEAIALTEKFFVSIGMPITITGCVGKEISDADIEDMANKCSKGDTTPIGSFLVLDKAKMIEIYKNAR